MNDKKVDNKIKRRVRGIERYFLRRPNANVIMVARIKGPVRVNELNVALDKVRIRHPLLGTRIELDDQNIAWFTAEGVPDFKLKVLPRSSNKDWIQTVIKETSRYFPLNTGPLIHFTLISSPDISELVINSHHTICDGMSLTYIVRDILLNLENLDREVEINSLPIEIGVDNLPPSVSLNILYRVVIKILNKIWERKGISFDEEQYKTLHQTFWEENKFCAILPWELTKAQTSSLVSRCREEGVSVHSALSTAFHVAQKEIQPDVPPYVNTLSMTANIRDRLIPTVGDAIGVYFSSFRVNLDHNNEKSFWANARATHLKIKRQLTDRKVFEVQQFFDSLHPTLVDSLYFSKYGLLNDRFAAIFLMMEGDGRINTSLDIANLGRLDFPCKFGNLQLEAIYGPSQYVDFQEKYLGVLTVGGRMNLTFTFDEDVISRQVVENIKSFAMRFLGEATGWSHVAKVSN